MTDIDLFIAVVAGELSPIVREMAPGSPKRHWVVIEDAVGIAVSDAEDCVPHEALRAFIDAGVGGAAYVTYAALDTEQLVAYIWVSNPENSDIRRCVVDRSGDAPTLGPWEYTV